MINDLLHPKNLVFRADVKRRNSPIYQKFFVYLYICINNISISVKGSNFTLAFFKAACHANPVEFRKQAGSSSYISRYLFQKFSNTSADNNVSF